LATAEQIAMNKSHQSIMLYTHELMHENIEFYQLHVYEISHMITENGYNRVYMIKMLQNMPEVQ